MGLMGGALLMGLRLYSRGGGMGGAFAAQAPWRGLHKTALR